MKRHKGLEPLSHDHHEGLVHALRMTKAAAGQRDAGITTDEFLAFRDAGLVRHFREEEEVLCPILEARAGADDAQLNRLLAEHRALETQADELRAARMEGRDLAPILGRLGELLEKHIRFEEREMFPRLEQMLTEDELMALPEHFAGGPSCGIAPPG